MKVEKDLLLVKCINFVFQASLACLLPYKTLYQKQLGLTPTENGILQSIEKALTLVASPVVGAIADKFSFHKYAMITCIISMVAFATPMYFVPSAKQGSVKVECCDLGNITLCNSLELCNNYTIPNNTMCAFSNHSVAITCLSSNSSFMSQQNTPCRDNDERLFCQVPISTSNMFGLTFALMLLLTAFYASTVAPVQALIDATTFSMLKPNRMNKYGMQRLWGSVGFGGSALLMGFLMNAVTNSSLDKRMKYLPSFVGTAIFGVLAAINCHFLKVPAHSTPSILSGTKTLAKNPLIVVFLFVVLMGGVLLGVKYTFVLWFAESLPGANPTIFGVSILVGCFTEIPVFFVSGWASDKVGHDNILFFGLLVASLRCYLYTVLTSAWQLILVEALHGLSFAFPMASMCAKAYILAPVGMSATLMGLAQGVYWGLGCMLGALIGGVFYEKFGAISMFRLFSALGVASAVLFLSLSILLNKCLTKSNVKQGNETDDHFPNNSEVSIPLNSVPQKQEEA